MCTCMVSFQESLQVGMYAKNMPLELEQSLGGMVEPRQQCNKKGLCPNLRNLNKHLLYLMVFGRREITTSV